jgi:hypothetical protein
MANKKLSLVLLEHFEGRSDSGENIPSPLTQSLKEILARIASQTKNLFKRLGHGVAVVFKSIVEANRRSIEIHNKVRSGQNRYFNNYGIHIRGML